VNTGSLFGSIYIGDGIRSNDLPFMIWLLKELLVDIYLLT
jgi:hypothetical protein